MPTFQPTKKDIETINWVYQCRRAHIPHLMTLTQRSRRKLNSRLIQLTKHNYINVIKRPFQHYIYTIGIKSAPILVEQGIATHKEVSWRVRIRETSELFIKHEMMIVDIHVALVRACRENNIKLTDWREGRELYDSVETKEDGERIKYPVRPDAFFTLQNQTRPNETTQAHFFLEADRATTRHTRFQKKIKGYANYHQQGLHTKKYGIKNFRVLTIASSEPRAINLCEAIQNTIPNEIKKFYYFAPISHFHTQNPKDIFKDIFISPKNIKKGKRYHLMPPVAPITANP